jgi:hypothetical protein
MAFELRFSVLPLIDSIIHFAFDRGLESSLPLPSSTALSGAHEFEIAHSSINLQRFADTNYFKTELLRFKTRARKRDHS